jgi:hypothetical protein
MDRPGPTCAWVVHDVAPQRGSIPEQPPNVLLQAGIELDVVSAVGMFTQLSPVWWTASTEVGAAGPAIFLANAYLPLT